MVIREAGDGSTWVSTQEEHADLSAQFAAHWGNRQFAQLRPYDTLVFATTYHDSGYREWEGVPRMNVEKGRPYGHRERIPGFEAVELQAYRRNVEWVRGHDLYAGLLVSMHRTGLWRGRYQVLTAPSPRVRDLSDGVQAVLGELEDQQQQDRAALAGEDPGFEEELWVNYRMLQLFDLLSLYFCCDGYGEHGFKEERLAPVPDGYTPGGGVELRITPNADGSVRMAPYPFDTAPLQVSVRTRRMQPGRYASEAECRQAYYRAPAELLRFEITQG